MNPPPLSPALHLRRLNTAVQHLFAADEVRNVEVVIDIYWIFIRHTTGWDVFRRQPDLGKWILRLSPDQETLLEHAQSLLPFVKDGTARLAKLTNLATPRAMSEASVVVYCASADREALGSILKTRLGWDVSWKTNQETFARLQRGLH